MLPWVDRDFLFFALHRLDLGGGNAERRAELDCPADPDGGSHAGPDVAGRAEPLSPSM